ncbi:MAG: 1-deoxy-D-xylulose-5-phosphate reductoisomerase [Flavobacteriales bacterium]|nr:1-deoxy-D-xylulose-5-phosphate reductoisomerase [Flavobacteriales bacterium]
MSSPKKITILGSTGSIGTQALDVIAAHPDAFELDAITAGSNADLLIAQARQYKPNAAVIADPVQYAKVKEALQNEPVKVFAGKDAVAQITESTETDMVLTALVGFAGLEPTMRAIEAGKQIALANKETLVVAGKIVTETARQKGVNIYPVDSEHSAIFQCLAGEWNNKIEKLYLTASGGPFRGYDAARLETVTSEQALKHPNWSMGQKITIDSATLMNKGLEVIEARWLFAVETAQIDVIVHPQSIIHSIVQFVDGSMKAQMGLPDMKLPIQYALGFPKRLTSDFPRFDFVKYPNLTFEAPDMKVFKCLGLAFESLERGGNMPCVLNAANEVAVSRFLKNELRFTSIPELVADVMGTMPFDAAPTLASLHDSDSEARRLAEAWKGHN